MAEAAPHWSATREGGTGWQLRLMRWTALRLPGAVVDPLLRVVALAFALDPARPANRGSILYLTRVLGRPPRLAERHRHALAFARMFHDRVRLLASGLDGFEVVPHGLGTIERLVAEGRGGVLLGAHFGSFEVLRAFDRELPGLRVRYLMYPDHAEHSTRLLRELNPEVADRVISLARGPEAMMDVVEALDRGEFVAFLGDRLPARDSRSALAVPFLGGTIEVPSSPYIAAMAARVPLILCLAPRLGKDRYDVSFTELYDGTPVARSRRDAEILALARRYVATLEDMCRRHPYDWFNFFDIWSRPGELRGPASGRRGRGAGRAPSER